MSVISLELAKRSDAEALAQISRRAFHSDADCGGKGEGGPPGYDSHQWQASIMRKAAYYKIQVDGKIAGGAIVFNKGHGHYYLGRVFLDPAYHRQGIGLEAMRLLYEQFPAAQKWTLETPPWNTRTRNFYLKLGFRVVKETRDDVFFEKVMSS